MSINTSVTPINPNIETELPTAPPARWHLAWIDLKSGILKWRIWCMMATQDIKLRYRRSALGPFWLTLSMAITVYSMGFLYGHLFHQNLEVYFPFLAAGMLTWTLISIVIIELTEGFITAEGLIKQIKLPYTLYIHRVIWRNILIFFHNVVVLIPIIILFHQVAKINLNTFLVLPGLVFIYLNAFLYGLALAMIGARFRDIAQIIKSLMQVIFFMTPVMWSPSILPERYQVVATLNPFYAFIDLIRSPLMGMRPTSASLIMVFIITTMGILFCSWLFPKYRSRIIYWL